MFEYESVVTHQGVPLKTHVEELRCRAQAVASLQGGNPHYVEEVRIFREYAAERSLFVRPTQASVGLPPDEEGNEHQVWFRPEEKKFIKVSCPDFLACQCYTDRMRILTRLPSLTSNGGNCTMSCLETMSNLSGCYWMAKG